MAKPKAMKGPAKSKAMKASTTTRARAKPKAMKARAKPKAMKAATTKRAPPKPSAMKARAKPKAMTPMKSKKAPATPKAKAKAKPRAKDPSPVVCEDNYDYDDEDWEDDVEEEPSGKPTGPLVGAEKPYIIPVQWIGKKGGIWRLAKITHHWKCVGKLEDI